MVSETPRVHPAARRKAREVTKRTSTPRFYTFQAELACGHERTAGYYTLAEKTAEAERLSQVYCHRRSCQEQDPNHEQKCAATRGFIDRACSDLPVPERCQHCRILTPDHSDCCANCAAAGEQRRAAA